MAHTVEPPLSGAGKLDGPMTTANAPAHGRATGSAAPLLRVPCGRLSGVIVSRSTELLEHGVIVR